jgi:hypothetical protein
MYLGKGEININQWFFVVFRVRNPHVLLIEKPKNRVMYPKSCASFEVSSYIASKPEPK